MGKHWKNGTNYWSYCMYIGK